MMRARRWTEAILVRKIERYEVIQNDERVELTPEELERLLEDLKWKCWKVKFHDVVEHGGKRYVKVICERWE